MKQKTSIFLTFVIAVLLSSIIWGYYLFVMSFGWRLSSPSLMVISNFSQGKHVYLYLNGLQDRDISLCIPLAEGFSKIKRIDSWRYREFNAIWSKDNSVIAFELDDYFAAYDFNTGDAINITRTYRLGGKEPTNNSKDVDIQITNLINSRGGIGNIISCDSDTFVRMSPRDWQKFNAGLSAGKKVNNNKSS